jgi:hypothetical protein
MYDWYWSYLDDYQEDEGHTSPAEMISVILSVLGILANSFAIFAIIKACRKLTTHLKLVISLCCSDALILVSNFTKITVNLTKHGTEYDDKQICFNLAMRLTIDLALLATLFNLLGIAIDHYLAILKPLFYKKEMTKVRGLIGIATIWVISVLAIVLEIVSGLEDKKETESLCSAIAFDDMNAEFAIYVFIFVCLLVIILIYARVYICVIRRRLPHRGRHQQTGSRSVKTLVTTSLFVLTFVLFWTPIGIFNVYTYFQSQTDIMNNFGSYAQTGEILYVILLLNTISDPIIYALRLQKVSRQCFLISAEVRRLSTITDRSSVNPF